MKTLKEIREENALSIRDLALKAGISPNTITLVEHGRPARHITKRKIASALHIKPSNIDWNLSYKLP